MNIAFAERKESFQKLLPLTYTRPIADLRVGILTIAEKWSRNLGTSEISYHTQPYLQKKFKASSPNEDTIWLVDGVLPNTDLLTALSAIGPNEALTLGGKIVAAKGAHDPLSGNHYQLKNFTGSLAEVQHTWDIFAKNGQQIRLDYILLTGDRTSAPLNDPHTKVYGKDVFIEPGVKIKAAILNAENGPIYLGAKSEIQEGAVIRGPFSLGENSVVSMGAKIRGDSSTGPHCKIGGEISNCVFWGYSNKAHDGFLGNAVIGEWCNLGADTNNSNLKNNYDPVRMWDYATQKFIHTGLQFCGLIMGDHSKCGINTMFNTGTAIGVAANIFGEGFPRTIIPSFAWGGASGLVTHQPRKAFITADIVMKRRNLDLTEEDKEILNHIFEETSQYRVWEKS